MTRVFFAFVAGVHFLSGRLAKVVRGLISLGNCNFGDIFSFAMRPYGISSDFHRYPNSCPLKYLYIVWYI